MLVSATANASLNLIKEVHIDYPEWLVAIPLLIFLPIIIIMSWIFRQFQASRSRNSKDRPVLCNNGCQHIHHNPRIQLFGKYSVINEVAFLCVFLVAFTCFICILQLGLDQMPDASSSSITSFIAWFVFGTSAGRWIGEFFVFCFEGQLLRVSC